MPQQERLCQWNFCRPHCICQQVAHALGNFQNIPILISTQFEEIFVLNKMVFYDIAVSGGVGGGKCRAD